jgi:hypothetical protein
MENRPLCHLGMELTKQNRLPGPRCSAQAALVSASNPDHVMSGCGSSSLAREEKFSWRHLAVSVRLRVLLRLGTQKPGKQSLVLTM